MQFVFAATATPTPSPTPTFDPATITPGPEGFLVIAVIAIALILLVTDMMRRIRRGRVRADIAEELDAEEARIAAENAGSDATPAVERTEDNSDEGDVPPKA